MRHRCYQCFRPIEQCFCKAIPQIDNRTHVLIVQHVGERFHRFNTARIVKQALRHCQLTVGHNRQLGKLRLPLRADACLLYPGATAPTLDELPEDQRPGQLVIIDGTWHQAKTIYRDVPQLAELPCYRLSPRAAGRYRIRLEPDAQSLSTLEATAAALEVLEPETPGVERLLAAFEQMVDEQLRQMATAKTNRPAKAPRSRPLHVPQALREHPQRLVVAYGEAIPGDTDRAQKPPGPLNWVAQRVATQEQFRCRLQSSHPLPETALQHMQLAASDDQAVSPAEFRRRWDEFLRPHDVLILYHHRTYELLSQIGASQPACLILKSIFRQRRSDFRCVEELFAAEGLTAATPQDNTRAALRLSMAVALVEHLWSL